MKASKHKVNSLLRILHNPCLSLYVKRQVILSILQPSLEYSSKVWRCTTSQSKKNEGFECKKYLRMIFHFWSQKNFRTSFNCVLKIEPQMLGHPYIHPHMQMPDNNNNNNHYY